MRACEVRVSVKKPDGSWSTAAGFIPDNLLTAPMSSENDMRQDAATETMSSLFTRAYQKAYPPTSEQKTQYLEDLAGVVGERFADGVIEDIQGEQHA